LKGGETLGHSSSCRSSPCTQTQSSSRRCLYVWR
jgi:hypothetical protein